VYFFDPPIRQPFSRLKMYFQLSEAKTFLDGDLPNRLTLAPVLFYWTYDGSGMVYDSPIATLSFITELFNC